MKEGGVCVFITEGSVLGRDKLLRLNSHVNYYSRVQITRLYPEFRLQGTGAHRCSGAGAVNNWLRSGLQCNLFARGSQTKFSHVDTVCRNARQRPDRFHARRCAPLQHSVRQMFLESWLVTDF